MMRKLSVLLILALVASGCAASRAFRQGQDAVHGAAWDAAVAFFTKAGQANPDSAAGPEPGLQRADPVELRHGGQLEGHPELHRDGVGDQRHVRLGVRRQGVQHQPDGVTVEDALQQVLSANGYYYKVTNPRTILVIPDQPQKHQQYDELVVRVFYISHADATELAQLVNSIVRIPQMAVTPVMQPNKVANT